MQSPAPGTTASFKLTDDKTFQEWSRWPLHQQCWRTPSVHQFPSKKNLKKKKKVMVSVPSSQLASLNRNSKYTGGSCYANRKHPHGTPNCSSLRNTHNCSLIFKIQVQALGSSAQALEVFYCLIPETTGQATHWFSQSVLRSSGLKVFGTIQWNLTAPLTETQTLILLSGRSYTPTGWVQPQAAGRTHTLRTQPPPQNTSVWTQRYSKQPSKTSPLAFHIVLPSLVTAAI